MVRVVEQLQADLAAFRGFQPFERPQDVDPQVRVRILEQGLAQDRQSLGPAPGEQLVQRVLAKRRILERAAVARQFVVGPAVEADRSVLDALAKARGGVAISDVLESLDRELVGGDSGRLDHLIPPFRVQLKG
jgi:hypothetical protein